MWLFVPVLLCIFTTSTGTEVKLGISASCRYEIYKVDTTKSYRLEWNGEDPGTFGCTTGFRGNENKVCVEIKDFYIQGPGITLKYRIGFSPEREIVFTHNDSPEGQRYCGQEGEYFRVEIDANAKGFGAAREDTSQSYFTLLITAIQTKKPSVDSDGSIGTVVLIAVGVIALCAIVFCFYKCKQGTKANTENNIVMTSTPALNIPNQGSLGTQYSAVPSAPLSLQTYQTDIPSSQSPAQRRHIHTTPSNTGVQSSFNHSTEQSSSNFPTDSTAEPSTRFDPPNYQQAEALYHRDVSVTVQDGSNTPETRKPEMPPPSYAEVMNRM